MSEPHNDSDPWRACTWDGAREDVLRRGRAMSFREKVIWLEQAARLSQAMAASRSEQKQKADAKPKPPAP